MEFVGVHGDGLCFHLPHVVAKNMSLLFKLLIQVTLVLVFLLPNESFLNSCLSGFFFNSYVVASYPLDGNAQGAELIYFD